MTLRQGPNLPWPVAHGRRQEPLGRGSSKQVVSVNGRPTSGQNRAGVGKEGNRNTRGRGLKKTTWMWCGNGRQKPEFSKTAVLRWSNRGCTLKSRGNESLRSTTKTEGNLRLELWQRAIADPPAILRMGYSVRTLQIPLRRMESAGGEAVRSSQERCWNSDLWIPGNSVKGSQTEGAERGTLRDWKRMGPVKPIIIWKPEYSINS